MVSMSSPRLVASSKPEYVVPESRDARKRSPLISLTKPFGPHHANVLKPSMP
jgi:hypothetical protein